MKNNDKDKPYLGYVQETTFGKMPTPPSYAYGVYGTPNLIPDGISKAMKDAAMKTLFPFMGPQHVNCGCDLPCPDCGGYDCPNAPISGTLIIDEYMSKEEAELYYLDHELAEIGMDIGQPIRGVRWDNKGNAEPIYAD